MTIELLHGIRYYTLTRTSVPNHAGNIKDMNHAYTLLVLVRAYCILGLEFAT